MARGPLNFSNGGSLLLVRTLRININNGFDAANIRFAATRVDKPKNILVNEIRSERVNENVNKTHLFNHKMRMVYLWITN